MLRKMAVIGAVMGLLATPAWAQTAGVYGPEGGDWELTLSGGGVADESFSSSDLGFNGSIGYFLNDNWEVVVRQGLSFSDLGPSNLTGSTRVGLDYHFDFGRIRPFVGPSVGGVYGDSVKDQFTLGLQGGAKYYVHQKTFLFGMLEYQWLVSRGRDVTKNFRDGQFIYTIGIGFNF